MLMRKLVVIVDHVTITVMMHSFGVGLCKCTLLERLFVALIGLIRRYFEILCPRVKTRYSNTALRFPNVIHGICSI